MLAAAGLDEPSDLGPHHIVRRIDANEVRLYANIFPFLQPGELLAGNCTNAFYASLWGMARADSFDPAKAAR
jgi:hypothetical protein